jgi:RNA polymerase sigma factor (sigma-70 family)
MATGLEKVLDHIHRAPLPDGDGLTDGQLLTRFVADRDEAAFAALVRRHGPMVFGVCRRLLRDPHDSEDCFQAVFLVLACKASAVVKRESVSSFLHGVAARTALEARSAKARRRARERQAPGPPPAVTPPEPCDWLPLLDEELTALAEKYRSALVLCDLEGRPRKEAARLLGVPEGTLSSRLATARKMLARRLARRGVALSGGAALAVAVPAALSGATARAATLTAMGQAAAASTAANALMEGVLKAMFMQKVKAALVAVLVAAALGGGVAYHAGTGAARAAPPEAKADGKAPSELEALRRENELLRQSLRLALDRVETLEAQLRDHKATAEEQARRAEREAARLREFQAMMEKARHQAEDERRRAEAALQAEAAARERARADALKAEAAARERAHAEAEARDRAKAELLRAQEAAAEAQRRKELADWLAKDPAAAVEAALKALRAARDDKTRQQAIDALEAALRKLQKKGLPGQPDKTPKYPEGPGQGPKKGPNDPDPNVVPR